MQLLKLSGRAHKEDVEGGKSNKKKIFFEKTLCMNGLSHLKNSQGILSVKLD